MAYVSTNLRQIVPGSLSNGAGAGWYHASTDSSTQVTEAGFFAGAGSGRSTASKGMQVSDWLHHVQLTTAGVPSRITLHVVSASTLDQATSAASSAFNYGRNITVTAAAT